LKTNVMIPFCCCIIYMQDGKWVAF
jgi:hypothetical protein